MGRRGSRETARQETDGSAPGGDEYDDAYVTIDREVDLFNLMILPRAAGQDDDAMA